MARRKPPKMYIEKILGRLLNNVLFSEKKDGRDMGMFTGFICLFCFLMLAAKAITHRCNWKKTDRVLMKCHKPICVLLIVSCFIHMIYVVPVLKNRSAFVIITGIVSFFVMVSLICLCHIIKEKKKKMWWHIFLTIIIAICIVGHIVTYIIDFKNYQQKVTNIVFEDIELANIKDGTYQGEYDVGYIYAKVEVEIRDNKIVSINIVEHRNERGESAEKIIDDMVEEQEIYVDAVSGATNSSNVIEKAVENALNGEN